MRPLEWLVIGIHFGLGIYLGSSPDSTFHFMSLFIFIILLNGGTLALNSSFDDDHGPIAFLKHPPKPPKYLKQFSFILLALGLVLALTQSSINAERKYFFEIVLTCTLMSILYSVPPIRLKSRPGWDTVINGLGFGFFTLLAGFTSITATLTPFILKLCVGFFFLFCAFYPMTQIYQIEEDQERGDITTAGALGTNNALLMSLLSVWVAHLWILWAFVLSPMVLILIGTSLFLWSLQIIVWRIRAPRMMSEDHEKQMYLGLLLWVISDISVFLSYAGDLL